MLSLDEVRKMMIALGFVAPDERYLAKLAAVFGKADADHDGAIGIDEFPKLWELL